MNPLRRIMAASVHPDFRLTYLSEMPDQNQVAWDIIQPWMEDPPRIGKWKLVGVYVNWDYREIIKKDLTYDDHKLPLLATKYKDGVHLYFEHPTIQIDSAFGYYKLDMHYVCTFHKGVFSNSLQFNKQQARVLRSFGREKRIQPHELEKVILKKIRHLSQDLDKYVMVHDYLLAQKDMLIGMNDWELIEYMDDLDPNHPVPDPTWEDVYDEIYGGMLFKDILKEAIQMKKDLEE